MSDTSASLVNLEDVKDPLSFCNMEQDEIFLKHELIEYDKVCCCCLSDGDLINAEETIEHCTQMSYFSVINQCFNSELLIDTDSIHHFICRVCIQKLMESIMFKNQIVHSQKTILNFFKFQDEAMESAYSDDNIVAPSKNINVTRQPHKKVNRKRKPTSKLRKATRQIKRASKVNKNAKSAGDNKLNARGDVSENDDSSDEISSRQEQLEIVASMDVERGQCRICERRFDGPHSLRVHMNEHFVKYTCDKCGGGFATSRTYYRHRRIHLSGSFKCPYCGKIFDTNGKLASHKRTHTPNLHKCQYCDLRFKNHYAKRKHAVHAHAADADINDYTCDVCRAVCYTGAKLNKHVLQNHTERPRPHACDACGKDFYDRRTLENHMSVHTDERNYECTVCRKAFVRKKNLVQHAKIHSDVRDHVCLQCGEAFVQKCSLNYHMRKHEQD